MAGRASVIQGFFPHGINAAAVQLRAIRQGSAFALPPHFMPYSGAGRPLPPAVRQRMEDALGAGFGDVRIHTSTQPRQLGTVSYAHGANISVAPGHDNPATPQGQQTLVREAVHVLQQRSGRVRNPFGTGVALVHDRALEAEADAIVARVLQRLTAVRQPAWIRTGNRIDWINQRFNETLDVRRTGEQKWYSSWKPAAWNQLLEVYERRGQLGNMAAIGGAHTELRLRNETLTVNDLQQIGQMAGLRHLDLINCTLPNAWNTGLLTNLNLLETLRIYSPKDNSRITDALAGIAALPQLHTLELVRCDFVHDDQAYATLGTMTNLRMLDLARTLTWEKVQRYNTDVRIAVGSLRRLIARGRLQMLDVRWCTELHNHGDIQGLVDLALEHGVRIITDPHVNPTFMAIAGAFFDQLHQGSG